MATKIYKGLAAYPVNHPENDHWNYSQWKYTNFREITGNNPYKKFPLHQSKLYQIFDKTGKIPLEPTTNINQILATMRPVVNPNSHPNGTHPHPHHPNGTHPHPHTTMHPHAAHALGMNGNQVRTPIDMNNYIRH